MQGAQKDFQEVVCADVGDCHAMGQKPITFVRQVSDDVIQCKSGDKVHVRGSCASRKLQVKLVSHRVFK